jgi:hypothetical protein
MQEAQEAQPIASGPDMFSNRYDPETTFEGTFEISTHSVGKRCFPSYINTTDGERMICSYSPMEEYRHLDGKKVTGTGRRYALSPYVQQISQIQHFEITTMQAK